MLFEHRADAGKQLAARIASQIEGDLVVLALPRGGVPVAAEIAKTLKAPLRILVARKLGAPQNPEFGIGAIAPEGVRVLDERIIAALQLSEREIEVVERKEREELERREREYNGMLKEVEIFGKTVVLVDDGLATGVTARAAVTYVLQKKPQRLVVAIPVCARDSVIGLEALMRPQDEVLCLLEPYDFMAVGSWYKQFDQVSDEEVKQLMKAGA